MRIWKIKLFLSVYYILTQTESNLKVIYYNTVALEYIYSRWDIPDTNQIILDFKTTLKHTVCKLQYNFFQLLGLRNGVTGGETLDLATLSSTIKPSYTWVVLLKGQAEGRDNSFIVHLGTKNHECHQHFCNILIQCFEQKQHVSPWAEFYRVNENVLEINL